MSFPPTITEAAVAIRAGKLTSVELVEQCLARIDRYDDKIHAWVLVDREVALKAASATDQELASGYDRGPLHGIPIGVKDIIDVEGMPTRCGSTLTSPDPIKRDATVVARLRESGAIVLGKTVTCEWACFDPSPTRNPWNLERTPGGSSSGSAVAVAAGMCLGAIGTQTGGSVIRPAAFCGIVGVKPAWGTVSMQGIAPLSPSLDHVGVFAACIADANAICEAIQDVSTTLNSGIAPPLPEACTAIPPFFKCFDGSIFWKGQQHFGMSEEIGANLLMIAGKLREGGANLKVGPIDPRLSECIASHRVLMSSEAADVHRERFTSHPLDYGPKISQLIESGLKVNKSAIESSRIRRRGAVAFGSTNFDHDAVFIMPATSTTAPELETTGDPTWQALWSYAGLPALTLPCGLSSEGLPFGLQMVGRLDDLNRIFSAARWCERVIGFDKRPSLDD